MTYKKESLEKLLVLIEGICEEPQNEWFKNKINHINGLSINSIDDEKISEIYELCINEILLEQANQFYRDFKYPAIKETLIGDFVRMEKFKRQDNFEDFSLAANQQIECIVNHICTHELDFCNYIIMNKNSIAYSINENSYKLWQLILTIYKEENEANKLFEKPLVEWEYFKKLKAVLFYFHFNRNIPFYGDFKAFSNDLNEIYQYRNKNHRGGMQYDWQKEITDKVDENKYRYYFRFMYYLERFVSKL
jgi:hypothetical protein